MASAIAIIPATSDRQQLGVVLGDRVVEHRAQQERRDHAERRGDQDQEEDRGEARPVGLEQRQQPRAGRASGLLGRSLSTASRQHAWPASRSRVSCSRGALGRGEGREQILLRLLGGAAMRRPGACAPRWSAATRWRRRSSRVAGPHEQAVGLEQVEQADEVAGVDPQRLAELLLGERAGLAQDGSGRRTRGSASPSPRAPRRAGSPPCAPAAPSAAPGRWRWRLRALCGALSASWPC